MGKLVSKIGSNAQCIAQAIDVAAPKISQFNLNFIVYKSNNFAIMLQVLLKYWY